MRPRLTYANVVSSAALFLALTGGVVYAAGQIGTKDIANEAVTTPKLADEAVKAIKLAPQSVGPTRLRPASVIAAKIEPGAVTPSKLKFPVFYVASPSGGSQPVTSSTAPYPITGGHWTQGPEQINVIFGEGTATLAYDGSGSGSCQAFFDVRLDGQQVGGGQLQTSSTTPEQVSQSLGAQPEIGPLSPETRTMTVQVGSNGDCTPASTIDSTRFKVLDFG